MNRRAFLASLLGGALAVMLPTPPQPLSKLTSVPIRGHPRKLMVRWSIESAADLRAIHGCVTEEQILALKEHIDREIMNEVACA